MDKLKFNNKQEWRKFAIGLSVILGVITLIQWYFDSSIYFYILIAGIVVLFLGTIIPITIKPLFIGFSYLGFVLNWIMTRVILIILFYLIFTPIGIISRLFGKQFLNTKFDKSKKSYWIDRKESVNYEKQF